jgi:predicted RNA-binding protein
MENNYNITIEELMESKRYVHESSAIMFPSPKEYISPFNEIFTDAKSFNIKHSSSVINAEESGNRNIAYPRVMIEADYGEQIEGFKTIFGMVYSLEISKPIIKVYSGFNVMSCINLNIFNADKISQEDILGNYKKVYGNLTKFKMEKEEEIEEFKTIHNRLLTTNYTEPELNEKLGFLLRRANSTKIGTTAVTLAAKLLNDPTSQYYVNRKDEFQCTAYNLYNAVTHHISNKGEFLEKPNKTVQLSQIFLN